MKVRTFLKMNMFPILGIVVFLLIWPLGIIGKTVDISSNYLVPFSVSPSVSYSESFEQSFFAKGYKIKTFEPDLYFQNSEGSLLLELLNGEKTVFEKEVGFSEITAGMFSQIPVDTTVVRGRRYTWRITNLSKEPLSFYYSEGDEDAFPGADGARIGTNSFGGNLAMRSRCNIPMDFVNVVFSGGFLFCVCFFLQGLLLKRTESGNNTLRKVIAFIDKIFEDYGLIWCIAEIVCISALIIYICRNEAVDFDESFTWMVVSQKSLKEMFDVIISDVHPPFYYLLLRACLLIFPKKLFVFKMVTLFPTILLMIFGSRFISKHWNFKSALLFNLIAGLGPQFIIYNVNVKMYSWMNFFVAMTFFIGYELIEESKTRYWISFVIVQLGAIYTQYFTVVPLAIIDISLFVFFLVKDRKEAVKLVASGIAIVIGYLPWLKEAMSLAFNETATEKVDHYNLSNKDFLEGIFETELQFSSYIPLILWGIGIIGFAVLWKNYTTKQKFILCLSGAILPLTWAVCYLIASHMPHPWVYRYLLDAVIMFWLFLIVLFSTNTLSWLALSLALAALCFSAFMPVKNAELGTNSYIPLTKACLQPLMDEDEIIYDMPTFDTYYSYFLPNADFVWYENFEPVPGKEIYIMNCGGAGWSLLSRDDIDYEYYCDVRLEQGIYVGIYRVICK